MPQPCALRGRRERMRTTGLLAVTLAAPAMKSCRSASYRSGCTTLKRSTTLPCLADLHSPSLWLREPACRVTRTVAEHQPPSPDGLC